MDTLPFSAIPILGATEVEGVRDQATLIPLVGPVLRLAPQ